MNTLLPFFMGAAELLLLIAVFVLGMLPALA
jgi:hypothetical protein